MTHSWRLLCLVCLLLLAATTAPAAEQTIHRGHAIAMHGEPKYGPDFTHFDYVNPEAPVGGIMRLGVTGTFDSFNPYIIKGNPASGIGAETLTVASADEPFTQYGLIAETITWPEDRSWVSFTLRPEARWRDGAPITVEDVIFSFRILKEKGRPIYRFYYGSIEKVEKTGPRTVTFTFSEANNRELPLITGQLPILPRHYWEAEGRDFERSTLEPPLSSGLYRVAEFEAGRHVILERDPDYWGADLAVNRGQDNFQTIRYDYFRDDTVLRQALKAGRIDFRRENQAKAWALDYDVPAVRRGWLRKEVIENQRPTGMQAFIYNARRPPFDDKTVRLALAYAFDFPWTNRVLFFDQYTRTESFFSNSELASSGLPEGDELALLERFRGRVPAEVFTEVYDPPTTDGSGWPRDNLKRAFELLGQAGWHVRDMVLTNDETGRPFRFEILITSPTFERVMLPFVRNLKRLGIDARIRLVDQTQYINRIRSFDFDMFMGGWGQSDSPGNEQRAYWSSAAADQPGTRNYVGIRDPAIDALIELVIQAPTREALVTRTRALDRVLLWGHYVIPAWHLSSDRILSWDKFSRPEITPKDGTAINYWWYDAAKAAKLKDAMAGVDLSQAAEDGAAAGGSGFMTTVAWAGGLLLAAAWLIWRLMRRPTA